MLLTSVCTIVCFFLLAVFNERVLTNVAEREAFRWVQKYISAFGGDPTKVMM